MQFWFRQSFAYNPDDRQTSGSKAADKRRIIKRLSTDLDAIVFWLACSRIMWCFFYQPERLPRSYVKWITSLADMDSRLLLALRAIRNGSWQYARPSETHAHLLITMASDLALNPLLGDPNHLPAHGGAEANRAWTALGYQGRRGIGGVPCNIVHCGIAGDSCTGNALLRGLRAFGQALLIYTPVHVIPALLSNPTQVLTDPLPIILSLVRSASFLSTFVSSIWFTVCFVRTLFIARIFPQISHNILDGPQGCILAGCLICGASLGIENGRRRGEIALYVLPRAIRACLPDKWVKSGSWSIRGAERLAFVLSLASILTTAVHQPEVLRGLSRWTVAYIMSGTSTGFWKRRRQDLALNIGDGLPPGIPPNTDTKNL
ncbi:hypothetical protein K439DRAFT_1338658 [Ramaria rubella]|nr:hypothetical protein K439DRAFT_1338658 [Ramaria rubella]